MPLTIADRGTVAASDLDAGRGSCAFPYVCVLPGGRWLCSFRAAPVKSGNVQTVLFTWSDDQGRTWRPPIEPFGAQFVEGRRGLLRGAGVTALGGDRVIGSMLWVDNTDPALSFFNEETEGLLDSRIFLARSEDGGETWAAPERMDTTPFDMPTPITGPILRLANGELACQFELNKHYYDPAPWHHSSVLMYSSDGGRTWPAHAVVTSDPEDRIFYWDQRPAVLADGRILDVFWTFDRRDAVYLNIHGRESLDHGRTWSELWDTGVPGQPAPPVSLPDGLTGMVYVDRTVEPVIKMRTSADHGRSWSADTEIVISAADVTSQTWRKKSMQDAWSEMAKFSIGLPATALLGNGDTLVVYYAGPETDRTGVEWVRVRCG